MEIDETCVYDLNADWVKEWILAEELRRTSVEGLDLIFQNCNPFDLDFLLAVIS
jgi:hypothetical protein